MEKVAKAETCSATTASEWFSQPKLFFEVTKLMLGSELNFLPGYFGQHGQTVLNPEYLDLAVLQVSAVFDERAPSRMQWLLRWAHPAQRSNSALIGTVFAAHHESKENTGRIFRGIWAPLSYNEPLRADTYQMWFVL